MRVVASDIPRMHPVGFTGKLLDRYLANGWYRMGTRMFTCRYNYYPWGFLTTVWTRLPLADHKFPKGTAKVMRRNARAGLTHEVHRARATHEEERVFAAYKVSRDYDLHDDAAHYCSSDPEAPFDTWQISVRDAEGELLAFSYFDLGARSAQSVCGFYDPAYHKHSLGLYTLSLEVEHCKRTRRSHHYAGYVVPGNETFEYKRRVGALEYFDDVRQRWHPIAELDTAQLPDAVMREALAEYGKLYDSLGRAYTAMLRPRYFIGVSHRELQWLRREPLPFCITDERANRRPYWACHFYSYNYRRFFSLLCTSHSYEHASLREPPGEVLRPGRRASLARTTSYEPQGAGVAVGMIHHSTQPYTAADLQRVWWAVAEANRG